MLTTPTTQDYAEQLYHYLSEPGISDMVHQSDWLLVLGCNDISVAEHAAQLWHRNVAPKILFSGGFGRYTRTEFTEPEAVLFAKHAMELGVNKDCISLETHSSNTQENIERSLSLISRAAVPPPKITLVTKPLLCRRVAATFAKLSSIKHQISCTNRQAELLTNEFTHKTIHQMVGEIDRLKHYPNLGFCNDTLIPGHILSTQKALITLGFTQQRLKTS